MPGDPWFDKINPWEKLWLYNSWIHKKEQEMELVRAASILTGSFSNPEMAEKMMKRDRPDYVSTDEDETLEIVRQARKQQNEAEDRPIKSHRRRKRKVIKD